MRMNKFNVAGFFARRKIDLPAGRSRFHNDS